MVRSVNVKKTKSSKKIVLKITMSMTVLGSSEQGALEGSGAGVRTLVLGRLTARGHFGNKVLSKMACVEVKMMLLGVRMNRQPFPPGAFPR